MASAEQNRLSEFDALYTEYGTRIYRFCHRLSSNPSDAEDLTQEVFLAAYHGLAKFEGRSSMLTWLYKIAVFRWHKTKRPDTLPLEDAQHLSSAAPDPATIGVLRISLDQALNTLPDIFREAFLLVKAEELTCREAAEILNIPQGTLKFRVYEATRRLQAQLKADGGVR